MPGILRATLLAAVAAFLIPVAAAAQEASVDSLLRRIDVLERQTIDLERRVRELEAMIMVEPSGLRPAAVSLQSRDIQNWRRLRLNMTMDQVRALLGEPERVEVPGPFTFWRWNSLGGANVSFDNRSGKVEGWSEPRQ
jgi:hypothetical protein